MGGVFHDDQQSGSICACAQKVDNVLMLSYVDKNLELWSEVSVLLFSGIGWNFEVDRQKKSLVIRRLFIMVNHPTASSPQPNIIITIENVTSKCNDFSADSKKFGFRNVYQSSWNQIPLPAVRGLHCKVTDRFNLWPKWEAKGPWVEVGKKTSWHN